MPPKTRAGSSTSPAASTKRPRSSTTTDDKARDKYLAIARAIAAAQTSPQPPSVESAANASASTSKAAGVVEQAASDVAVTADNTGETGKGKGKKQAQPASAIVEPAPAVEQIIPANASKKSNGKQTEAADMPSTVDAEAADAVVAGASGPVAEDERRRAEKTAARQAKKLEKKRRKKEARKAEAEAQKALEQANAAAAAASLPSSPVAVPVSRRAMQKRRASQAAATSSAASAMTRATAKNAAAAEDEDIDQLASTPASQAKKDSGKAAPVAAVQDEEIDELDPTPRPSPAPKKRGRPRKTPAAPSAPPTTTAPASPRAPIASTSTAVLPGSPAAAPVKPTQSKKRPRSDSVAGARPAAHSTASGASSPARPAPANKKRKLAPSKAAPPAASAVVPSSDAAALSDVYPLFLDSLKRAHPQAFAPPLGEPMLALLQTFMEQFRGHGRDERLDEQGVLFEVLQEVWRKGLGERLERLVAKAGEVVKAEQANVGTSRKGKEKAMTQQDGMDVDEPEQPGDERPQNDTQEQADGVQETAQAEAQARAEADASAVRAKLEKKEAKRRRRELKKQAEAAERARQAESDAVPGQKEASVGKENGEDSDEASGPQESPQTSAAPAQNVPPASAPRATTRTDASQQSSASGDKPRRKRLGKKEKAELRAAALANSSAEPSRQSSPTGANVTADNEAQRVEQEPPVVDPPSSAATVVPPVDTAVKQSESQRDPPPPSSSAYMPQPPSPSLRAPSSPAQRTFKESESQREEEDQRQRHPPPPSSEFATAEEDAGEPDTEDDGEARMNGDMEVDEPMPKPSNGEAAKASPSALSRLGPALEINEQPPTPERENPGESPTSRKHSRSMSSAASSEEDPEELALSLRIHASPARSREQPLPRSPLGQTLAVASEDPASSSPDVPQPPPAAQTPASAQQSVRPEDVPLPPSPTGSEPDIAAPPPLRRLETIGGDDSDSDSSSDESSSESDDDDEYGNTPVKPSHPRRTSLHRVASDAFGKPQSARKPRSSLAKVTSPLVNKSSQPDVEEEDDFDQLLSQSQPRSRLSLAHVLPVDTEEKGVNGADEDADDDDDDEASSHFSPVEESREPTPRPAKHGLAHRKSRDSSEYPESEPEQQQEAASSLPTAEQAQSSSSDQPPQQAATSSAKLSAAQSAGRRLSDIASVSSSQAAEGPFDFDLSNDSQSQDAFKPLRSAAQAEESQFVGNQERDEMPLFNEASQLQEIEQPSANPLESSQIDFGASSQTNGLSQAMDQADTPRQIVVSPPSEDEGFKGDARAPSPSPAPPLGRITRGALARASSPVMTGPRTPRAATTAAGKRLTRASSAGLADNTTPASPSAAAVSATQPTPMPKFAAPRPATNRMPSASQPLPSSSSRLGKRASGMKSLSQLDEEVLRATPKRARRAVAAQPPSTAPPANGRRPWIANGADDDDDDDSSSDEESGKKASVKSNGFAPPAKGRKSAW